MWVVNARQPSGTLARFPPRAPVGRHFQFPRLEGENTLKHIRPSLSSTTLLATLLTSALLAGCSSNTSPSGVTQASQPAAPEENSQYVAPDAKGVHTIVVQKTEVPDYLDIPAHIEPDPTSVVRVFPPAGGRIIGLKVRPWDHVSKGQTLATLESGDLSRAVADYHKAAADARVKQQQLTRAQDLLGHGAIAERDFQQAESDAQAAQAELASAREQIRVYGMDPDKSSTELSVVAPRGGVILDIGASTGEYSKSLDAPQPLCTIADISSVWAIGDIYEKDFAAAKAGQAADVTLNAYPDRHWTGTIAVVSGAVDPVTRTLHARVVLENPGELIKPAMFGSIRLVRSTSLGIFVPASAVMREGKDSYIFVAVGNSRFMRRSVTIGHTTDTSLEILSGLNPGDTIVSDDPLLLRSAAED
jgi:membrane fusion protein, heavy metal efflux system